MSPGREGLLGGTARDCGVLPAKAVRVEIIVPSVYSFLQVAFLSWDGR